MYRRGRILRTSPMFEVMKLARREGAPVTILYSRGASKSTGMTGYRTVRWNTGGESKPQGLRWRSSSRQVKGSKDGEKEPWSSRAGRGL